MSYANQRNIRINKIKCDALHPYILINNWALQCAMKNLKGSGFKLWSYFAKNRHGYTFDLSKEDCIRNWGMTMDTYYAAFKELVEKRYLIETSANHYSFYEIPDTMPQLPTYEVVDYYRENPKEYMENPK